MPTATYGETFGRKIIPIRAYIKHINQKSYYIRQRLERIQKRPYRCFYTLWYEVNSLGHGRWARKTTNKWSVYLSTWKLRKSFEIMNRVWSSNIYTEYYTELPGRPWVENIRVRKTDANQTSQGWKPFSTKQSQLTNLWKSDLACVAKQT